LEVLLEAGSGGTSGSGLLGSVDFLIDLVAASLIRQKIAPTESSSKAPIDMC
jgi:hypothetical protein